MISGAVLNLRRILCRTTPVILRRSRVVRLVRLGVVRIHSAQRLRHVSRRVRLVSGPRDFPLETDELVVLCLVRNGSKFIQGFIDHYRTIGTSHIVFLDNGSTDGTVELAAGVDNVTLLRCNAEFREYAVAMKQYLIATFGRRSWALVADIDELFDYPFSTVVPLEFLTSYLERYHFSLVATHMLDMFDLTASDRRQMQNEASPPAARYHHYDLTGLHHRGGGHDVFQVLLPQRRCAIPFYIGGIREESFGVATWLTKHALFYGPKISVLDYDQHVIRRGRIADMSCAFYHYLFTGDFRDKCEEAVVRRFPTGSSQEYRSYLNALHGAERPDGLRLRNPRYLRSVDQLVEEGFLQVSDRYLQWISSHRGVVQSAELHGMYRDGLPPDPTGRVSHNERSP